MTGRDIWRQMTKFWGLLFGINFAMGVATGITMEFQFGMNWAYYSHYVGDIFGAPLAIEGLMAFFLEATFIGLFFFGWDKLSRVATSCRHLARGAGVQSVGAMDSDRQRLDAASSRRPVQPRHNAHGAHRLHGGDLQSRGASKIRPYRERRLCHGIGLRPGHQFLLSVERTPPGTRQPVGNGRCEFWSGGRVIGRRSWRRKRLHGRRKSKDEDRRHRGNVGHRACPSIVRHLWLAQPGDPSDGLRGSRSLDARLDRDAVN